MASINIAYPISRTNEGGYTIDSGGETYKGVSRNANPNWAGWKIIDAYKKAHGAIKFGSYIDSPELDKLVLDLFKTNYWDVLNLDSVKSQNIANIMFDFSLTSGTKRSAINVQKAAGVTADGAIGTDSLRAINAAKEKDLSNKILANNQEYYSTLAQQPKYASYLKSWSNRVKYFQNIIDKIPDEVKTAGSALGVVAFCAGLFFLARKAFK